MRILGLRFALTLSYVFALSFAAAQHLPDSRAPLVPCADASEGMPCVEIVTEMRDIVGVWRRYYQGASAMGFTEFREDGTLSIVQSLPGDDRVTGIVRFDNGVASFAANPDGPAPPECKAPGRYELRLIRVGEQPVVLAFSHLGDDGCVLRVGDFAMPMVYYGGSGEELAMDAGVPALAQALVPCPEAVDEAYPCDLVVTRPEDAAGIWKQYLGMAPDSMGYHRINPDGTFVIADSAENTAAPFGNYPFGAFAVDGWEVRVSVEAPNVPPMCQSATQRFHVYRYGAQPVALLIAPIEDECAPRLQDTGMPFVWVADAD